MRLIIPLLLKFTMGKSQRINTIFNSQNKLESTIPILDGTVYGSCVIKNVSKLNSGCNEVRKRIWKDREVGKFSPI